MKTIFFAIFTADFFFYKQKFIRKVRVRVVKGKGTSLTLSEKGGPQFITLTSEFIDAVFAFHFLLQK